MTDEPTTEKLARAIAEAAAKPHHRTEPGPSTEQMIALARDGYYDDYKSPVAMNMMALVTHARAAGLMDIAGRAISGDFDATKEESDAWAASAEGQATFRQLLGRDEP